MREGVRQDRADLQERVVDDGLHQQGERRDDDALDSAIPPRGLGGVPPGMRRIFAIVSIVIAFKVVRSVFRIVRSVDQGVLGTSSSSGPP